MLSHCLTNATDQHHHASSGAYIEYRVGAGIPPLHLLLQLYTQCHTTLEDSATAKHIYDAHAGSPEFSTRQRIGEAGLNTLPACLRGERTLLDDTRAAMPHLSPADTFHRHPPWQPKRVLLYSFLSSYSNSHCRSVSNHAGLKISVSCHYGCSSASGATLFPSHTLGPRVVKHTWLSLMVSFAQGPMPIAGGINISRQPSGCLDCLTALN
ncbi:hypothetical protein LX36DRAFT_87878 [Colletotrichum falcatum]|nr:hypothetical protein LX36DRAFT_87878 [Colletotrichum falcatum]